MMLAQLHGDRKSIFFKTYTFLLSQIKTKVYLIQTQTFIVFKHIYKFMSGLDKTFSS